MPGFVKNQKDFVCGLLLIAIAALFAFGLRELPIGTAFRMGPGYFPMVLSGLLAVLGAAIAINAILIEGLAIAVVPVRERLIVSALIALVGGVLFFFNYWLASCVVWSLLLPVLIGLPWRGLVHIVLPVVFFGATLRGLGFVLALGLTAFFTTIASARFKLWVALLNTATLVFFGWLIFIWGLRLPLPLLGPWVGGY